MQKLRTLQRLKQGLHPQQIQFMNLLQLPAGDLSEKIRKEIEENPALEQEEPRDSSHFLKDDEEQAGKKQAGAPIYPAEKKRDHFLYEADLRPHTESWREELEGQARLLHLSAQEKKIVTYLIGALSPAGYLETRLELIVAELALLHDLAATPQEAGRALHHIQQLDPPGVGARNLQESLQLQLQRKKSSPTIKAAREVIGTHFLPFAKRQYPAICAKMKLAPHFFQEVLKEIRQLKPQPIIGGADASPIQRLEADFLIRRQGKRFAVEIPESSKRGLRIHDAYETLLKNYKKAKEKHEEKVLAFIVKNIQRAKWFIQAVEQRHRTLLRIMEALVEEQRAFFSEEDIKALRPLTLRQIAERIGVDMSTVSRAIRRKSVRTEKGLYRLKFFFSEALPTKTGQQVSSRTVKKRLRDLIAQEDKGTPHTDEALVGLLEREGFLLARRTVAKYREQAGLPPSYRRRE